jgi:ubiquitin C-terminal hydrolase
MNNDTDNNINNINNSNNNTDNNVPNNNTNDSSFESDSFLPIYDLLGVSNHCGTLNGGHYIAHVDTNNGAKNYRAHQKQANRRNGNYEDYSNQEKYDDDNQDRYNRGDQSVTDQCGNDDSRWMCFNDEHVSTASTANIIGPSAYVLFYRLRES